MKPILGYSSLAALAFLLGGCLGDGGGGGGESSSLTVDELPAGAYAVSVGEAAAPKLGKYYSAADGSRLLVLVNAVDQADRLYRKAGANDKWVAVPAQGGAATVSLLRSDKLQSAAVSMAGLAGSYVAQVAAGTVARFSLAADGTLTAGAGGCKLGGKLAAGTLPNTLKLSLTASGCGSGLPATSSGVLVVDGDYAPAKFRLVADEGGSLVDLWAYAE